MPPAGWARRMAVVVALGGAVLGAAPAGAEQLPRSAGPVVQAALVTTDIRDDVGLPRILGAQDTVRYARVFALQEEGRWAEADALIALLDDRILLGHVLAQRYLHPTKYRTSYPELAAWLERYGDHPNGHRLYRLAERRRPEGAAAPAEPSAGSFGLEVEDISPPLPPLEDDGLGAEQARIEKLVRKMRKAIQSGDPASAQALLTSGEFTRLADDVTYDRAAQTVAFALFLKGKAKTALGLAANAAERSGDEVPLSQWTAGLAAYKLERYEAAERFFAALARNRKATTRQQAAGGYWAFRAAKAGTSAEETQRYLLGAAEFPTTFYGLLAQTALGRPIELNWNQPGLNSRERDELLRYPEVRRALALVQAGQRRLAELEFSSLDAARDPGRALTVLGLATRLGLPATEIRLGYGLADNWEARYLASLYPMPMYRPSDGFKVDRALLFAFMRQESAFNAFARSSAGAVGLMQLMPRTAAFVGDDRALADGKDTRLLDPEFNLTLGQGYIAHLMAESEIGDNLMFIAAAYNAGPGNLRKWRNGGSATADPLMFLESLPSAETRHFVQQVMANFWLYRARLGQGSPSLVEITLDRWPSYDVQDKRQLAAYAGN